MVFRCTVNGETQSLPLTNDLAAWQAATFYFKAGAYYTVPAEGATAQVSFGKLELSRGELRIKTAALPNGTAELPYSQALETFNGAGGLAWSVESGALPPGLALDADGVLSGTPSSNGVFRFSVQVQDGEKADLQPLCLAIDKAASNPLFFSEDFESGQTVGAPPAGATTVRPYTNDSDHYVKVVDAAGNVAGSGNGVRFADDDASDGTMLTYNFVADAAAQVSAVRVDFSFAAMGSSGAGDDYVAVGLGEYNTGKTFNTTANRYTEARLLNDGTIDFKTTAPGGSSRTGTAIPAGSNTLSIFANDLDAAAVDYVGLDGATYSLPANSVAYWLNGSRVVMNDGRGYLAMDVDDPTTDGTVGTTTNNLGKFGFNSSTSYVGLDYLFDNISVSSLDEAVPVDLAPRAVQAVSASSSDGNLPENTLDGSLATRWSAEGQGEWIAYDLGVPQNLHGLKIAWYLGDTRSSTFSVEVSVDGTDWATVVDHRVSSGTTAGFEEVALPATSGRYLRIVGFGNSSNDWNSILETEILGVPAELAELSQVPTLDFSGTGASVSFPSVYGALYRLQAKEELVAPDWQDVGVSAFGTGGELTLGDPGPLPDVRFYRLLALP